MAGPEMVGRAELWLGKTAVLAYASGHEDERRCINLTARGSPVSGSSRLLSKLPWPPCDVQRWCE